MEYHIDDIVMYGADGVCSISEITERKIGTELHKYYILKPIFDNKSTIMVPLANERLVGKMKELLSNDEIKLALEQAKDVDADKIENTDGQKEAFHNAIDNSDIFALLRIARVLYERRKIQEEKGKRLHVSDERMLKEAEKVVFEEFAQVLNIDRADAANYVRSSLLLKTS